MAELSDIIQQQSVAIEQLNDTMSGISSVMDGQLESLKSIARWQDQTALYTSHLQNIKVDLNQIRKWGENINHIADRIDVLANQEDAERQEDLSGGEDDAVSLSGALLEQIADNTLRTAIAVEQIASVQAEPFEDKRTQTDAKPISRREQKSKAEQGEIGKAVGTAGTFLGEVFKGFLALGTLVGSVLLAPSSFFETVREFFASLKGLFTQAMGFFVNDVAPVISFLFQELLGFFNRLAPELAEMGAALGDSLRKIGPDLWNTISPVLSFIGDGIIKTVDMLTDAFKKLPEAVDAFGKFISSVMEVLFDPEGKYDTHLEAVSAFFDWIFNYFNNLMEGDFSANFSSVLYAFWNMIIDLVNEVMFVAIDAINMIREFRGEPLLQYEDYFIDRSMTVENTDLTQQLSDLVASAMAAGLSFDDAVKFATSTDTIGKLLMGDKEGNVDYRVAGLDYMKSKDIDPVSGRLFLDKDSPGAEVTREIFKSMTEQDVLALADKKFLALATNLTMQDDAPAAAGAFAGGEKYRKISGIHDAIPRYSEKYGVTDTVFVLDKPDGKIYDHYYKEDGTRVDLTEGGPLGKNGPFLANYLTQLVGGMADEISAAPTPTPATPVTPKNTFGGGTGANISRSSVDNRFVLDSSVHGPQPPVVSTVVSGAPVITNTTASQVQMNSGSRVRNPFYTK